MLATSEGYYDALPSPLNRRNVSLTIPLDSRQAFPNDVVATNPTTLYRRSDYSRNWRAATSASGNSGIVYTIKVMRIEPSED